MVALFALAPSVWLPVASSVTTAGLGAVGLVAAAVIQTKARSAARTHGTPASGASARLGALERKVGELVIAHEAAASDFEECRGTLHATAASLARAEARIALLEGRDG